MEYRPLGSTGLRVSVLGLGCNRLGWPRPGFARGDMVRLLEQAADAGVTFYDTAESYAGGESERVLGDAFGRGSRRVVIATKIGATSRVPATVLARTRSVMDGIRLGAPRLAPTAVRRFLERKDFSPASLRRAVEGCRRRLRRDRLDIVQLHSPPAQAMRRDDTFETLERLKAEGAIAFYGVSFETWGPQRLLPSTTGMSTLQLPVSVASGNAVDEALSWAAGHGIGVIANQPFEKGRLLRIGRRVPLRGDSTRSLAQAALRAVIQVRGVSVVLVGVTSDAHLRENAAAIEGPPLAPDEIARLRAAFPSASR